MAPVPVVVVVFTGGTISMLPDPVTGAAVPALDGAAILARTPGLDAIAHVEPVDWGLIPASHLGFDQVASIAASIRAAQRRPEVAGVVVVQGTDVIEETAYAFDLLCEPDPPVIVVGAMRNAADPGYEGPANLRDAVRVAASGRFAGEGALVVMGGLVIPADDVAKTHTHAYDTFRPTNAGPVGTVRDGAIERLARRPSNRRPIGMPIGPVPVVALVTATIGSDGSPLRWAVAGGAHGIVVAATGAGNTHPDLLVAATEAMAAGIPVVLASRVPAGRVAPDYGFPGAGARWHAAGAIPAGYRSALKARVLLALALGAGLETAAIRTLFSGSEPEPGPGTGVVRDGEGGVSP